MLIDLPTVVGSTKPATSSTPSILNRLTGLLEKPLETFLEASALRLAGVNPAVQSATPAETSNTPRAQGLQAPAPEWIPGVSNTVVLAGAGAVVLGLVLLTRRR